jgi:hypothetical protein
LTLKKIISFYNQLRCNIEINSLKIPFTNEAEHLGIVRSTDGNIPHLLNRFSAHHKAMMAILRHGMAQSQNGNPAASIRAEAIYGTPVLLSGIPSLSLSKSKTLFLDTHHKIFKESLLRLYPETPAPIIFFLSGTLPATGIIHIRQLTIFCMSSHLKSTTLYNIALASLSTLNPPKKSWFTNIKDI